MIKPVIRCSLKTTVRKGEQIVLYSFCLTKVLGASEKLNTGKVRIVLKNTDVEAKVRFAFKKGIPFLGGSRANIIRIAFDIKELLDLSDIQNKLNIIYKGEHQAKVIFDRGDGNRGDNKNSRIIIEGNRSIYFRQSSFNAMYITVRETNYYDTVPGRIKTIVAKACSIVYPSGDNILMFEKWGMRYEESASVLYEKLLDAGYDNVYYIINKDNPVIESIDEKYHSNLLYRNSFKFLMYFFKCEKFIGTESLEHAIQLRAAFRPIVKKIRNPELAYVFLQHGVMYMVSLNADTRIMFRQMDYKINRVVVSSELEAKHFIELGEYSPESLYITGLAKFDRNIRFEEADKIVVMLTWRRWEGNLAENDFGKTGYYAMTKRIVSAIPEKYRDRILILPHPLMQRYSESANDEFSRYFVRDKSHDEVLRDCSLLITDYSSIAYDAFYRGSNVIFCWSEKDECMKHYGKDAFLMLNEGNVFGDVCYNVSQLRESVEKCYNSPQEEEYIERYNNIVQFHDGRNSERIIGCLKKDGIIN